MATPARSLDVGELEELLCSRCAKQEAGPSGFCEPCLEEHVAEDYAHRDAIEVATRRKGWRRRGIGYAGNPSSSAQGNRERQRRHRLLEAVRPHEQAPAWADPLELGWEAIALLRRLRQSYRQAGLERLLPQIDQAEELVRQLAWGPAPPH